MNRTIYVVGFAPKDLASVGAGGFDWFYTEACAMEHLQSFVRSMPDHAFRITEASVYEGFKASEITKRLDAYPDSWRPFGAYSSLTL